MNARRLLELGAIVMIGGGAIGRVAPRSHSLLWRFEPEGYMERMEGFAERPGLVRALADTEVPGGLWLALSQYEDG